METIVRRFEDIDRGGEKALTCFFDASEVSERVARRDTTVVTLEVGLREAAAGDLEEAGLRVLVPLAISGDHCIRARGRETEGAPEGEQVKVLILDLSEWFLLT